MEIIIGTDDGFQDEKEADNVLAGEMVKAVASWVCCCDEILCGGMRVFMVAVVGGGGEVGTGRWRTRDSLLLLLLFLL